MIKSKKDIIDDITNHLLYKTYSGCYVGITSDVDSRLFGDHKVSEKNDHWIHREATSDTVAREVEQHFLDAGMDGGSGGGDETSKVIYAYKKTSSTKP